LKRGGPEQETQVMTFVYIVRCNFTEPRKEQAWNDWYSGPKIQQMLAKPYFRTCQRFRLASGTGRNYLALWTLQSPEAFKTTEYRSDWGFFEWGSYITDWSRDLFDAGSAPEAAFAVAPGGSLHAVSFDGMSADDADVAHADIAGDERDLIWLPVAGLDRHTPLIGLKPLPDVSSVRLSYRCPDTRVATAIYRPISDLCTAVIGNE
jgi:hypothetical protein